MVRRMVESRGVVSPIAEKLASYCGRFPELSETGDTMVQGFEMLERYGPFLLSLPLPSQPSSPRRSSTEAQANVSFIHSAFEETIELLARCIPQSYTDEIGMLFFARKLFTGEIERCEERWGSVCIKFQVSFP